MCCLPGVLLQPSPFGLFLRAVRVVRRIAYQICLLYNKTGATTLPGERNYNVTSVVNRRCEYHHAFRNATSYATRGSSSDRVRVQRHSRPAADARDPGFGRPPPDIAVPCSTGERNRSCCLEPGFGGGHSSRGKSVYVALQPTDPALG